MQTKYVTIEVTQRHIDDGQPMMCGSCPVALAIQEKTGLACVVYGTFIAIGSRVDGNGFYRYLAEYFRFDTPKTVAKFIERYDDGLLVKPFKFRLPLTDLKVMYG